MQRQAVSYEKYYKISLKGESRPQGPIATRCLPKAVPASERPKVCRPNGCNRKPTLAHRPTLVQVSRLECLSARLGRAGGIKQQSQPALGMRAPPGPKYSVGGLGGVSHSRTHIRPLVGAQGAGNQASGGGLSVYGKQVQTGLDGTVLTKMDRRYPTHSSQTKPTVPVYPDLAALSPTEGRA